jgi:hypothetical protein
MGYPPSVSDFQAYFTRDFNYGSGPTNVTPADIQRGLNEAVMVFNPGLWSSTTEQMVAYLYVAAHFMVLNIQEAGGLSAQNLSRGVQSKGGGTIESKGVGSVNVSFAVPDFVRQSPILSQFMRTDYGQKYIQLITPRLVGNVTVVAGEFPINAGIVPPPSPLQITTLMLPSGTRGTSYSQAIITASGVSPLTFAVSSGSLPTGLSLNAHSGLISGTPSSPGTYFFEITVTDGLAHTASMNYQVIIT